MYVDKVVDNYINNLIGENKINENNISEDEVLVEKFSPASLFKTYNKRIKSSVYEFLDTGSNMLIGGSIGLILGTIYFKATYPLQWSKNLLNSDFLSSAAELNLGVMFAPKDSAPVVEIIAKIKVGMEAIKSNLGEPMIYGSIILGMVTALAFTLLLNKGKDEEEAKKEIRKKLQKNDKLSKDQQKVCKILADKVYK